MSRASDIYPADRVSLREVGLRDGLQLVRTYPSSVAKKDWIRSENFAGMRHFEVGSFLPAARFPQFADVRTLIEDVTRLESAHCAALTLNERGVEEALQTDVGELVCVVSATEEHSQANMRRSRADAVALVKQTADLAKTTPGRPLVNVGIAMAFGCSIAGAVDPNEVLRLAEACLEAGADVVGVADTVGFAGPDQIATLAGHLVRICGNSPAIVHLHDTRGMGIANASAALDAGVRVLDGSLGGLGGCPFAPGATGNVVLEDLVYLCETKGFATGIDLEALIKTRAIAVRAMPDEPFFGALAKAGPPPKIAWQA